VFVSGDDRDNTVIAIAVVVPCLAIVVIAVVVAVLIYCYKVNKNRYKMTHDFNKQAQLLKKNRTSLY